MLGEVLSKTNEELGGKKGISYCTRLVVRRANTQERYKFYPSMSMSGNPPEEGMSIPHFDNFPQYIVHFVVSVMEKSKCKTR